MRHNPFEELTSFKEYMLNDFKQMCKERYGHDTFTHYISSDLDDFMAAIEEHIAELGDQELECGPNDGFDRDNFNEE